MWNTKILHNKVEEKTQWACPGEPAPRPKSTQALLLFGASWWLLSSGLNITLRLLLSLSWLKCAAVPEMSQWDGAHDDCWWSQMIKLRGYWAHGTHSHSCFLLAFCSLLFPSPQKIMFLFHLYLRIRVRQRMRANCHSEILLYINSCYQGVHNPRILLLQRMTW